MADCSHNCSSCKDSGCSSRKKESLIKKPHQMSDIKKVVAVVSGKGGVGKSMTCALLAAASQESGKVTAVMDADITGPSIPRMFGADKRAMGSDNGILPVVTENGVQIMSMNVLLENEAEPVVWRGSLISGTVLQFWTDVIWTGVEIMFIDMPPGTGDVPLTVFQSIPIDGVVVVTTPQDLVGMIVQKAVNMAQMMNVPILGIVENMSYIECPDCGRHIPVFGESKVDAIAMEYGIPNVAKLPIDRGLTVAADTGKIEEVKNNPLTGFLNKILKKIKA